MRLLLLSGKGAKAAAGGEGGASKQPIRTQNGDEEEEHRAKPSRDRNGMNGRSAKRRKCTELAAKHARSVAMNAMRRRGVLRSEPRWRIFRHEAQPFRRVSPATWPGQMNGPSPMDDGSRLETGSTERYCVRAEGAQVKRGTQLT